MSQSAAGAIAHAVFNFESHQVRTVQRAGEVWFAAADVCAAIDVHPTAVRRLEKDEKGLHITQTLGGEQTISIINESGLYSLILRSRKPEARRFARWVTAEVLPSIRKTGHYAAFPLSGSFLATIDATGAMQLLPLAAGSYALPPSDWPKVINEPGALTTAEILDVLDACTKALRQRRWQPMPAPEGAQ